jgi:hypothetical protein
MRLITEAKSSWETTGAKLDFLLGGSWAWSTPMNRRGTPKRRTAQRARSRVNLGIVTSFPAGIGFRCA